MQDNTGRTPLHEAATHSLEIFQYLLNYDDINISATDTNGKTAISYLPSEEVAEEFRQYLMAGAIADESQQVILATQLFDYCVDKGWLNSAIQLKVEFPDQIPEPWDKLRLSAFERRNAEALKSIISITNKKLDSEFLSQINFSDFSEDNWWINPDELSTLMLDINATDSRKDTILNHSMKLIDKSVDITSIQNLIAAGANVNHESTFRYPPLYQILATPPEPDENLEATIQRVELFLDSGANPNLRLRKDGKTSLHLAAKHYPEVIPLLIRHGADITIKDKDGYNPLQSASKWANFDAMKEFINVGSDIGIRVEETKDSLLHLAIKNDDNGEIIRFLLEKGFFVDDQNAIGETPLHLTVKYYNPNAAKILIEQSANVDDRNIFGETPLHKAIQNFNLDVAMVLIENGANVNAEDNAKLSVLEMNRYDGMRSINAPHYEVRQFTKRSEVKRKLKGLLIESGAVDSI